MEYAIYLSHHKSMNKTKYIIIAGHSILINNFIHEFLKIKQVYQHT